MNSNVLALVIVASFIAFCCAVYGYLVLRQVIEWKRFRKPGEPYGAYMARNYARWF